MMVILEVTPDEAEILRWAQRAEKTDPQNYIDLSLALRSDKDNDAAQRRPRRASRSRCSSTSTACCRSTRVASCRPTWPKASRGRALRRLVGGAIGERPARSASAGQLEATEFDD